MKVSRRKIAVVIADRLKHGENLSKLSKEVASYLLYSGRSSELNSIMRDVIAIRADEGNVEATVISAHELNGGIKKEVRDLVKAVKPGAKRITLDEKLDPDLIGGLKLSVVDHGVDLSIRAKLNKLKQLANQEA
ncbi:MAG: F0F1 ATP synthase subunit delta [Candidatus Saccharibacteria bacterium]